MGDYDKEKLLERGVASAKYLGTKEKETSITFSNDREMGSFYSEVSTTMKWFLSIEESVVDDVETDESGRVIRVRGKIPKGIVKLKGKARKSNNDSQMVSYGPYNQ